MDKEPKIHALTSHELARLLLEQPDVPVSTEGCDCNGEAGSVEFVKGSHGDGDEVLIMRTPESR